MNRELEGSDGIDFAEIYKYGGLDKDDASVFNDVISKTLQISRDAGNVAEFVASLSAYLEVLRRIGERSCLSLEHRASQMRELLLKKLTILETIIAEVKNGTDGRSGMDDQSRSETKPTTRAKRKRGRPEGTCRSFAELQSRDYGKSKDRDLPDRKCKEAAKVDRRKKKRFDIG
jgi:hypothetical protein